MRFTFIRWKKEKRRKGRTNLKASKVKVKRRKVNRRRASHSKEQPKGKIDFVGVTHFLVNKSFSMWPTWLRMQTVNSGLPK